MKLPSHSLPIAYPLGGADAPYKRWERNKTVAGRPPASRLSECAMTEPKCPKTVSVSASDIICQPARHQNMGSIEEGPVNAPYIGWPAASGVSVAAGTWGDLGTQSVETLLHFLLVGLHDPQIWGQSKRFTSNMDSCQTRVRVCVFVCLCARIRAFQKNMHACFVTSRSHPCCNALRSLGSLPELAKIFCPAPAAILAPSLHKTR